MTPLHRKSERPAMSTSAGLIGSTLAAAAGFALGAPAMQIENLISANPNQDTTRRGSTPTTTSGGFSSIFNLKSVISAATKPTQISTTNSNFNVPPPITVPTAEQAAMIEAHAIASSSPKSVQGTQNLILISNCVRICFMWRLQLFFSLSL